MADRTPASTFAKRRQTAIAKALIRHNRFKVEGDSARLDAELMAIHREDERERGEGLAQRIADGLCAVLGDTCLTHNQKADLGHQLAIDPTTSTD